MSYCVNCGVELAKPAPSARCVIPRLSIPTNQWIPFHQSPILWTKAMWIQASARKPPFSWPSVWPQQQLSADF